MKAVRLLPSRKGFKLDYAGLVELPHQNGDENEPNLTALLQSLLKSGDLRRARAVINLYGKPPLVRYLLLPVMPKDELREAVKWEAKKKMTALPLEDISVDYIIAGEQEERGGVRRYEVILVAAEKHAVQEAVREIQRAGPRVEAMDVSPLSLINAVRLNHPRAIRGGLVFIDIGAGRTEINIAKQGILRFTRTVQMGGNNFNAALQKELQLDYEEAEEVKRERGLSSDSEYVGISVPQKRYMEVMKAAVDRLILEVQRSLDYYRAQYREDAGRKIILMGGTPLMPGFSEYFSAYFDADVEVDNPFSEISCRNAAFGNLQAMAPRFSSSIGLALRNLMK
jgi:type IV pilus assembly protein PilM